MPSTQKIERVAELKERIEDSAALLLTEYRGLTVSEITELRASLRDGGARFAVIKNTLMRRALEQTDAADLGALVDGPSAVAFVQDDPVAAAKSVTNAAKKFPALVLKGGFVEGRLLSADEATALADLESREVMLSKLAGMMKSEMARAAAAFQAAQSRFLSLLEAFEEKLRAESAQEAAAEEAAQSDEAQAETDAASGEASTDAADEAPQDGSAEAPADADDEPAGTAGTDGQANEPTSDQSEEEE